MYLFGVCGCRHVGGMQESARHAVCFGFSHTLASLVCQPCGAGVGQGGQGKAGIVGIGILVGFLCSG